MPLRLAVMLGTGGATGVPAYFAPLNGIELGRVTAAIGLALAAAIGSVALIWSLQRRLIYLPDQDLVLPAASVIERAQEVSFQTEDGLRINAWFVPARGSPLATVLVCNGNAGNRSHRAPLALALADEGFSVLLFDYRGYGRNPGSPTEAGLLRDARAAREYLAGRGDVDPARLAYFGESLGAAVATSLAVEHPAAALVLRSPFTSVAEMGRLHYPWLPLHPALIWDPHAAIDTISRVRSPLLVIAGERDGIVPPTYSRRVYDAAPGPKRFVLIAGADHNDRALFDGAALVAAVVGFLKESLVARIP
jgi:fermentation-respiration switch protein FrsA (DUF1100 family)